MIINYRRRFRLWSWRALQGWHIIVSGCEVPPAPNPTEHAIACLAIAVGLHSKVAMKKWPTSLSDGRWVDKNRRFWSFGKAQPHEIARLLERCDVILTNMKFAAVSVIFCASSARAREVDLARFAAPTVAASDENGSVSVALHAKLQDLGQPYGALRDFEPTEASGQSALSCLGNGYLQTWWLSAEVERRRATYFEAMSEIACENGLPAGLLDAVVAQESGYKSWAISEAGAMGMMQVMPGTARNLGLWNPWDALANMRAGARYLRQQLDRFGRVDLALAAYNSGPDRRSLAAGYVPAIPETRNYVRTITTNWLRLTQLEQPGLVALERAAAASLAVRASGYREVSLTIYEGLNVAKPI